MSLLLAYLDAIALTERLHRQFLEIVKVELENNAMRDVNNVQAMILFNVGDHDMTIGELTLRGCYLGSNVSYNVKKLVEHGYLDQQRSLHDRRSNSRAPDRKGDSDSQSGAADGRASSRSVAAEPARRAGLGARHRNFSQARPVLVPVPHGRQPFDAPLLRSLTDVPPSSQIPRQPGASTAPSHGALSGSSGRRC